MLWGVLGYLYNTVRPRIRGQNIHLTWVAGRREPGIKLGRPTKNAEHQEARTFSLEETPGTPKNRENYRYPDFFNRQFAATHGTRSCGALFGKG